MSVPTRILLTIDSKLFNDQAKLLDGLTVQGQLAALLVFPPLLHDEDTIHKFWLSVLPSTADLKQAIPAFWRLFADVESVSLEMRKVSPKLEKFNLKQTTKCQKDVETARRNLLPFCVENFSTTLEQAEETFKWGWLLVNTRSFFYDLTKKDRRKGNKRRRLNDKPPPGPPSEECMALCPVIDYLNHADDEGCEVGYNTDGYNVRALRDHDAGEELTVSYGKHGNDYLLVEYGFALADNPSDSFTIDHILLPNLSENQRDVLQEHNMLGDYVLSSAGEACHRTACALRTRVFEDPKQWTMYIEGRLDEEEGRKEADVLLRDELKSYLAYAEVEDSRERVERTKDMLDDMCSREQSVHQGSTKRMLIQRREEVHQILKKAIKRLEGENN